MSSESPSSAPSQALRWIPVRGDSMWPSLRDGDVAGVEPLSREPRPGEVVLARFDDALVLHRVCAVREGVLSLRGDNAAGEDPPIAASRILGCVARVRRRGVELDSAWDGGPSRLGRLRALVRGRVARWLGRRS
ncbi:S24/S26 family peptidase [Myxococcus sp. MISCRS1]|uniref:S24 family peptidase n=1 Tax=Myxococcus TaxID=32 RepID=UPI001CC1544F|nr:MULTISPECIES: S24/S26 family peptidase [unclassified Myxococcus]MBZ4397483.1 S24/S26 family peptidase [Myxococcus sp. AS-1-15]MCY1003668.1 S24/S26 family peptidase [Myxococcus sp. MISCRS1]